MQATNPFANLHQEIEIDGAKHTYYNLLDLKDERLSKLPYSIRVLLESAVRNCDDFNIKRK